MKTYVPTSLFIRNACMYILYILHTHTHARKSAHICILYGFIVCVCVYYNIIWWLEYLHTSRPTERMSEKKVYYLLRSVAVQVYNFMYKYKKTGYYFTVKTIN